MAPFTFTGLSTLGYPDYADTASGHMLVAEPGQAYGIRAIDGKATVPPPDGRWTAASGSGGAPPPPPSVPPVPSVPAVEGSEG